MRILAIETSCDETAIALLEINGALEKPDIKVLGNSLLSQIHIHEKYGGVYPNLAKREHEKNLPILLKQTLEEAGYTLTNNQQLTTDNIDCIAVTAGPGLEPALWTGITFAENLGRKWSASGRKVPVVPVNHMEGHVFSVLYNMSNARRLTLPGLALLVSGGHTELVHVKDFGNYKIIGRTRDDAVGEAFDKAARMLGLPYPGGPQISRLAALARKKRKGDKSDFPDEDREHLLPFLFPRPMIKSKDFDFSYSGLKTALLYKIRSENRNDEIFKQEMACAFEEAAIDVLIEKSRRALVDLGSDIKTFIVAGGVSANIYLRAQLENLMTEFPNVSLKLPDQSVTGDNAIMIGIAAYVNLKVNKDKVTSTDSIKAEGNLTISSAP